MANYKKNGIPLVVHYVRLCPNDIKRANELGIEIGKVSRAALALAIIEEELKHVTKSNKNSIYGEFNARKIKRTDSGIQSERTSLLCASQTENGELQWLPKL